MIRFLLAVIVSVVTGVCASGGVVQLRLSADVEPGAPVLLGDIAALDGREAEALRGVVVREAAPAAGEPGEVALSDVRRALDESGVNWGLVALRGNVCALRTGVSAAAPARRERERPEVEHEVVDLRGAQTVRTYAARTLAAMFGVSPEDLRLAFDDSERALLDVSDLGRRIETQPLGESTGSRVPIAVWVYEADRVIASGTVRADVRVRRPAVVLTQSVARGERIRPGSLSREVMWLEPTGGTPVATVEEAVGGVARARMQAGTVLRLEHLEAPVVIRRGELVTVHCVSGGVVVKSKARATHDARLGDMVELSLGRDRRSFVARADAPGRAVMRLGDGALAGTGGAE